MEKINKTRFLIYLIMLPYLKPYNISIIPWLDSLYKLWKAISTMVLIVYVVKRKIDLTRTTKLCFVFLIIWSISFYLNNGNLTNQLQIVLSIIGLYLFSNYIRKTNIYNEFLAVMYNIAATYILLHFITVIQNKPLFVEPVVEWERYFLGYENYAAFIILSLCGIMFCHDIKLYKHFRYRTWILGICALMSFVIPFSVSAMVSFIIFLCVIALSHHPKIVKIFSVKNVIIISFLFTVAIAIFRLDKLFYKITAIFGKPALQYREIIWPRSIAAFKLRWIIGYGGLTNRQITEYHPISGYLLGGMTDHAHNFLLEILLMTGIIGVVIFWIYFCSTLKMIKEIKDKKCVQILLISMSTYLLCGVFDFYLGLIYFYLLMITIENAKYEKDREVI